MSGVIGPVGCAFWGSTDASRAPADIDVEDGYAWDAESLTREAIPLRTYRRVDGYWQLILFLAQR